MCHRRSPLKVDGRRHELLPGALLLLIALVGCGSSEVAGQHDGGQRPRSQPAPQPESSAPEGGAEPGGALVELPGRATLGELAGALTEAGAPVELSPAVSGVARCLHLSLEAGQVPLSSAVERARGALEGAQLAVTVAGPGLRVDIDPQVLFIACPSLGTTGGLGEDELERLRSAVRQVSETDREVPRAALRALPRLERGVPEEARLVPYYREDALLGLRVYVGRSGSLLELLGLREGDLITHVGGRALDDPGVALRLPAEDGAAVVFRLLRDGEAVELRYRLAPEGGVSR